MEQGTVKWYNETKGYGFIQPDNGGKDVFVHATALERAGMRGLREGQKISYELQTDQRTGRHVCSEPAECLRFDAGGRAPHVLLHMAVPFQERLFCYEEGFAWQRKN